MFESDIELVRFYRSMDVNQDRIKILSELALKPRFKIIKILKQYGEEIDEKGEIKEVIKEQRIKKFLEMYKNGMTDREIAKKLGVVESCINKLRSDLDLPSQMQIRLSKKSKFLPLYNQGLTDTQIATMLKVSAFTVGDWRRELKLTSNYKKTKKTA